MRCATSHEPLTLNGELKMRQMSSDQPPRPNTQQPTGYSLRASWITLARIAIAVSMVVIGLGLFFERAGAAVELQEEGAELCFKCHSELKEKFSQAHVHTPVKLGMCKSCHNPHTAKFPKLLSRKGAELCYACHVKEKEAFKKKSVHPPVKEGNCIACHDPHAGPEKAQLSKTGGELCLTCHEEIKQKTRKYLHPPFETGSCLFCHDPHASSEQALLTVRSGELCQTCHDLSTPEIKRAHSPFPVEKAACEQCHNPHGSDNKALLKAVTHPPFAQGRCGSCHQVSGADPTKTILSGKELCLTCHSSMVQELRKKQVHFPVAAGQCTACHTPHASELKGLLAGKERGICLSCHEGIRERFRNSRAFHPEKAENGRCTICHMPHSSDRPTLLAGDPLKVCGACHKGHEVLSHPMGAGIIDPRNKKIVTCLSCHDPHGTANARFLTFPKKRELCIQCHKKFR